MIVTDNQVVSIHTIGGVQLAQFPAERQKSMVWSRDLREVSRCELSLPQSDAGDLLPELYPWLHWTSVWDVDAGSLLWTGPIQKISSTRETLSISSRDVSALMDRTRSPITKAWESTDPANIARELWAAMIEHHNLNVKPIVRHDPEGDVFDFECVADTKMLAAVHDDLTKLGLRWCVISGVPVLGPVPLDPVAVLGEDDLLGEIQVVRDGATSFNDVLLRGADYTARAKVPMAGLSLQTLVNVDSMFGLSNVERAVQQYARHTASIRDALTLPGGITLKPDAPVDIDDLKPGARFVIEARGMRVLMELETVEVTRGSGELTVAVTFESVTELPELAETSSNSGGLEL